MKRRICVFCSSSEAIAPVHAEAARAVGAAIGAAGHGLVWGGVSRGLMRVVADAATAHGAHTIGVLPEVMHRAGLAYPAADVRVTPDMRARKALMESLADGFIILPGGIGTLEEFAEIVTLKQIGAINKPVAVLNVAGHYDALLAFLEQGVRTGFARPDLVGFYAVVADGAGAVRHIEEHRAAPIRPKWEAEGA